ncbi:hypothetical protein SBBP1_50021 [Burkholderiales bacterium]|nr:hypothetical protein SBBP1_50021 [Burkholderiales bacterium]
MLAATLRPRPRPARCSASGTEARIKLGRSLQQQTVTAIATADAGGALVPTPRRLVATAERPGPSGAYFVRTDAVWQPTSWHRLLEQVQAAARALVALGVQSGDPICILGFNRPEWLIMEHAAMMAGAAGAGIYWTSAAPEVEYLLGHSKTPPRPPSWPAAPPRSPPSGT